jgi:hypothetical protein
MLLVARPKNAEAHTVRPINTTPLKPQTLYIIMSNYETYQCVCVAVIIIIIIVI